MSPAGCAPSCPRACMHSHLDTTTNTARAPEPALPRHTSPLAYTLIRLTVRRRPSSTSTVHSSFTLHIPVLDQALPSARAPCMTGLPLPVGWASRTAAPGHGFQSALTPGQRGSALAFAVHTGNVATTARALTISPGTWGRKPRHGHLARPATIREAASHHVVHLMVALGGNLTAPGSAGGVNSRRLTRSCADGRRHCVACTPSRPVKPLGTGSAVPMFRVIPAESTRVSRRRSHGQPLGHRRDRRWGRTTGALIPGRASLLPRVRDESNCRPGRRRQLFPRGIQPRQGRIIAWRWQCAGFCAALGWNLSFSTGI
jgi:hypothetical protein